MKIAKKREFRPKRKQPCYRLVDLLAQMPAGRIELSPELQAWENMRPVGREFWADIIRLSPADQERFAQALLSPPQPSPALKRALAHRKSFASVLTSMPNVGDDNDFQR
jgi:hypothetical protein